MQLEFEFAVFLRPPRPRRKKRPPEPPPEQLKLPHMNRRPWGIARKRRKHWAKYDFSMVEDARRLRETKQWTYQDIADYLNVKNGTTVAWISVRDWCNAYYRVTA